MFLITISLIIILFIFDLGLSILNYNNRTAPIPDNVKDVYEEEAYKKWLDYTMELFQVSIVRKVVNTSVLIVMLALRLFPMIHDISAQITGHEVFQTLIFFGIYSLITYFIDIGFNVYSTFSIEERYGFNKTTPKTFIMDQIKSNLLFIILGGGLLFLIQTLYIKLGNQSLFYVWGILIAIILLINVLYTRVFIKIFYKITPLEEGELYDGARKLAESLGYEIKNISVMDASKRSTRLNAFFIGFGKFKSIVLFDTLIEKCSTEEILSVLAHEIGHAKQKDTIKNLFTSMIQFAFYLTILSFFLSSNSFAVAFGFNQVHFGFALILFSILMEPIGIALSIPLSALSRKAEYGADRIATEAGYGNELISSLKILAKENFANLTPHPLLVKMRFSHPPVTDRISAIEKIK